MHGLSTFTNNLPPIFGFFITIIAYYLGLHLQKKLNSNLANPMIIAVAMIIILLTFTHTSYEVYNNGAKIIGFLLGPATVALAIPLCRQIKVLTKNIYAVSIGVFIGSLSGVTSAYLFAHIFHATPDVALSLVPKSVTTPIAMEISALIGGIPALTAGIVIITGLLGAVAGPKFLDLLGVRSNIARGLAIGSAAHALGTIRCMQENELQGAMSGVSIALVGLSTALIAPFLVNILSTTI